MSNQKQGVPAAAAKTSEMTEEQRKELLELARVYHTTFTSKNGSLVLSHLQGMCSLSALSPRPVDLDIIEKGLILSNKEMLLLHEGEDKILIYIRTLMNFFTENQESICSSEDSESCNRSPSDGEE
mmetsp:Transcript_22785/g.10978  ORF Transcript_22785/g.10978 Transcript_22785/m.10978 type:complete len:126 (-) Transcript_22785:246-623(-)